MRNLLQCLVMLMALVPVWGQSFRVLKAEYGADNTWIDVTQRVTDLVRGNGLEFRVDGETLTDPLPGVQKTLRIRYTINNRMRTDSFKDLDQVRLGFPGGNGNGSVVGGGQLRIVEARYGADRRFADVAQLLNNQIQGNRLYVQVTNATMGGDPAPANKKSLQVTYEYRGQRNSVTVAEEAYLDLPGGNAGGVVSGGGQATGRLEIVSATFGNGNNNRDVTSAVAGRVANDALVLTASGRELGLGNVWGFNNVLTIVYRHGGRNYESRVRQNGKVELPNRNDPPPSANSGNVGNAGGGNTSGGIWNSGGNAANQLVIESAMWGVPGRTMDVSEAVRGMVRDGRLSMRVDVNTLQSDPAVGASKELVIRYHVGSGSTQTSSTREGRTVNLP